MGGALEVGGSNAVANTGFSGTDQLIPAGLAYQHIRVTGSARLAGNTTATGDWVVSGSGSHLTLDGHSLTVGGNFTLGTDGFSLLTKPADRLIVTGNASFSSGNASGRLTAGEIQVAGNFSTGGTDFQAFASTGTLVRLNGSAPQTVSLFFAGPNGDRFHRLVISNPAGVEFASNMNAYLSENPDLVGRMTVPAGVAGTTGVTIEGTLFLRSTSVLTNNGTINVGTCEKEAGHTINGTDPCP